MTANRRELERTLVELAELLVRDFEVDDVLRRVSGRSRRVLGADGVAIALRDDAGALDPVCSHGPGIEALEARQVKVGAGPGREAYAHGETVVATSEEAQVRWPCLAAVLADAGIAAVVALPMVVGAERIGALTLYWRSATTVDADALDAAATLAKVATAYVVNARAAEESRSHLDTLSQLAWHDSLTGLFNRARFLDALDQALEGTAAGERSVAVLTIDCDRLKSVNDTYGHLVGDQLLQILGQRMAGVVRPTDVLARIGGDEFAVLLQQVRDPVPDAAVVADRLLSVVRIPVQVDEIRIEASISVGVVVVGVSQRVDHDAVLGRADAALYLAKLRGGDRMEVYGEEAARHVDQRRTAEHRAIDVGPDRSRPVPSAIPTPGGPAPRPAVGRRPAP